MFSFLQAEKEEVIAVFDIGNGSIGGAFMLLTPSHPPKILYVHREPLAFLPRPTSKRLLESMLKLLKLVAIDLQKNGMSEVKKALGHHTISDAYCTLSSPWYVSQTKKIYVEREKPFMIGENVIEKLIAKEQEIFQKEQEEGKYEKIFGNDIMLLEKKIIHTKLNGYEIENPIGKKAENLDVTFFMSFISTEILKGIEDALYSQFHFNKISYSSFALASWSVVRDTTPETSDFISIDVTGEVTDLLLTAAGVLTQTSSFPLGRNSLIRSIVDGLVVPPEVAVSYLSMNAAKKLDSKIAHKVKEAIEMGITTWYEGLIAALTELNTYNAIPRKIFIFVDDDCAEYIIAALSKKLPPELSISSGSFEIHHLNGEALRPYIEITPGIYSDPFIFIESIFINKLI